jgi:RNA polymerase sigma-70 factor (ECF subfamily)
MNSTHHPRPDSNRGAAQFVTTLWSVVASAGGDTKHAEGAIEKLCRAYWYPLYAFVRRQGRSPEDAQDLTQAFFAKLIERALIKSADPNRGRFRTFLLCSLKNFLRDEWAKGQAQKRGGGERLLSLDDPASAEARYQLEPRDEPVAEKLFERRWAMTVIDLAISRLESEFKARGKEKLFDELQGALLGEKPSLSYAKLGAALGMIEGAVKVAAHRLQRRYRELVREEIGNTVASPDDIEDEIRHLCAVLSG